MVCQISMNTYGKFKTLRLNTVRKYTEDLLFVFLPKILSILQPPLLLLPHTPLSSPSYPLPLPPPPHLKFCELLALLSLKPFLMFLLFQLQLVQQLLPTITVIVNHVYDQINDHVKNKSVITLRTNQ